ncbi:outer dense fiber protein 2-like isoform X1 [Mytilus californianus]|uniref:outer dense fiber protein 2-like isoform X1 n=1 Tax=Mytilus californianus TaxID=6549 RepID=UPI002246AD33|nr:outer dense fiber protein 2-like isoform X1 [Mytilus californianus]
MSMERGLRATSPVHVHVEDDVPIHVHVKQKTKTKKAAGKTSSTNLARSGRIKKPCSAKARVKSSQTGPWVPAPAKSSRSQKVTWQGPTHRLEINNPTRVEDLSTDEEEQVHDQMRGYEKKIDSLMTEVGTLKNEKSKGKRRVELQHTYKELEDKEDMLEASKHVMAEQSRELDKTMDELTLTERENRLLRKSVELLADEKDEARYDTEVLGTERERLMKKLIETEMDGQAAVKQIGELRDALRRLREENRISSSDSNRLSRQKDLLLEKMADFEATNKALRRILREQHEYEAAAIRLGEQRDVLLKKLADSDRRNERIHIELDDRDRHIRELRGQISAQRNKIKDNDEEVATLSGLQHSIEQTRAHLQKQLRQKEADCNRMAVQVRTVESSRAQDKIEIEHLTEMLAKAKDKAERDKEALKKATRVQKQRATKSHDALEQLSSQLLEKDAHVEELRSQLEQIHPRYDKVCKEKSQILAENSALKTRLGEVEALMDRVEHSSKSHTDTIVVELREKQQEVAYLKADNEKLKSSIATIEAKFRQADEELIQLRGNLKQYENLVEEYKSQMNKSRREADETMAELDEAKQESHMAQREGEIELEKVKVRLHQRLQELEPLPEMLKSSELRLYESQERMNIYEKKNGENTKLISELTAKVEHVTEQMDQMRNKWHDSQDENKLLGTKVDALERKLRDSEDHNRDLSTNIAKRDEALHQTNLRLEEKVRENAGLTRQLENALTDLRRQSENVRDKQGQKERTYQARITDLESQLSQARAEIAKVRREKEESERKFNSRLYDIKDRLEQSHSTNRSMQNYVQFLKNSYANVFGDSVTSYPPTPIS